MSAIRLVAVSPVAARMRSRSVSGSPCTTSTLLSPMMLPPSSRDCTAMRFMSRGERLKITERPVTRLISCATLTESIRTALPGL